MSDQQRLKKRVLVLFAFLELLFFLLGFALFPEQPACPECLDCECPSPGFSERFNGGVGFIILGIVVNGLFCVCAYFVLKWRLARKKAGSRPMSKRKKRLLTVLGVVLFVLFLFAWPYISLFITFFTGVDIDSLINSYPAYGGDKIPATIHESGWSTPVLLEVNDAGWEDSPFITRDGSQLLFYHTPIPNMADPNVIHKVMLATVIHPEESIAKSIEGKVYVSEKPFVTKQLHPSSQNKTLPYSDACPYISASGDFFVCSTKESWVTGEGVPATAYMNGVRLDFGTSEEEGNPHYCDARDEMWFDCPGDTNLCMMRDARKNNFKGNVVLAPHPINHESDSIIDFQAFLTDDCDTLYFTSNRESELGALAIFRTSRLDEAGTKWSAPTKFISSPGGSAEVSMTANGTEMVWVQLFWRDDDSPGLDIWYSKKEQA